MCDLATMVDSGDPADISEENGNPRPFLSLTGCVLALLVTVIFRWAWGSTEFYDDGGIVLLDVRTPKETEAEQLPYRDRTLHIPLGALRERMNEIPRDKWVVPFCKISLRGYEAERILSHAGFPKVSFLESGVVGWPYEIVRPEQAGPTETEGDATPPFLREGSGATA